MVLDAAFIFQSNILFSKHRETFNLGSEYRFIAQGISLLVK